MNPLRYVPDTNLIKWQRFFEFIEERARIWFVKDVNKGEPPWTTDPILQAGKFGNVWRELDRGTRWETTQVNDGPHRLATGEKIRQLQVILIYRHNLIPGTTAALMTDGSPMFLLQTMGDRPLVSNAINIWPGLERPEIATREEWAEYLYHHHNDVVKYSPELYKALTDTNLSCNPHMLHIMVQAMFPSLGEFKAYEVITSLSYLSWTNFNDDMFPHVGHGAMPALRMLTGDYETPDNIMSTYLISLAPIVHRTLGNRSKMPWPNKDHGVHSPLLDHLSGVGKFTVRTLEDCLCEYRKYCAVKDGSRKNKPYPDNLRRWENNVTVENDIAIE